MCQLTSGAIIVVLMKIKNSWLPQRLGAIADTRNIGLLIFAVITLAISWSGVKTIQRNYELQKQISVLQQQNTVLRLTNENTDLQNQYLQTDQYLELAARQNFGLAAPGETVLLVPRSTAMKYVDPAVVKTSSLDQIGSEAKQSKYSKNFQDWGNFLLGRPSSEL